MGCGEGGPAGTQRVRNGSVCVCVCASTPVCLRVCVHVCAWLALRSWCQEEEGSCEACLGSRPPQTLEAPIR